MALKMLVILALTDFLVLLFLISPSSTLTSSLSGLAASSPLADSVSLPSSFSTAFSLSSSVLGGSAKQSIPWDLAMTVMTMITMMMMATTTMAMTGPVPVAGAGFSPRDSLKG